MLGKKEFIQLNVYHTLIDALGDSVPVLLAFVALTFGGGEKAVGFTVSLTAMASTVAGLFTVALSKRFTLLQATSLILFCYGIGFMACAFAPNMVVVGLCFILAIFGHHIFHNMSFSYLTSHAEKGMLGKTMSDFIAIGDIGRIPLVTLAGFAAAYTFMGITGWRVVVFCYGGFAFLCALYLFWQVFVAATPENKQPDELATAKRNIPSFSLLKTRPIALSVFANALNTLSCDRAFTFLPLLLIAKGVDPKIIGSFALGFTLGSFVGKMACGRVIDRFGTKNVFIGSSLVFAALLVILISDINLPTIIIVSGLIGVVTKGSSPVVQTIVTEHISDKSMYADIFSINNFCRGVVNIISPIIFGLVASAYGIETIYIIMIIASFFAIMPILQMLREEKKLRSVA